MLPKTSKLLNMKEVLGIDTAQGKLVVWDKVLPLPPIGEYKLTCILDKECLFTREVKKGIEKTSVYVNPLVDTRYETDYMIQGKWVALPYIEGAIGYFVKQTFEKHCDKVQVEYKKLSLVASVKRIRKAPKWIPCKELYSKLKKNDEYEMIVEIFTAPNSSYIRTANFLGDLESSLDYYIETHKAELRRLMER